MPLAGHWCRASRWRTGGPAQGTTRSTRNRKKTSSKRIATKKTEYVVGGHFERAAVELGDTGRHGRTPSMVPVRSTSLRFYGVVPSQTRSQRLTRYVGSLGTPQLSLWTDSLSQRPKEPVLIATVLTRRRYVHQTWRHTHSFLPEDGPFLLAKSQ